MEPTTAVFVHVVVTLAGAGLVGYVVDTRARKRHNELRAYVGGVAEEWKESVQRVDATLARLAAAERTTPVSMPPPTLLQ